MKNFLDTIIHKSIPCYFISPHLDDAALSCGGLINYLAGKTSLTVISVFTAISSPPYTLSAKAFLKQCQSADTEQLFIERKKEDEIAFNTLGVKTKHLDFIDAQWRKKDRLNFLEKILGNYIPEAKHTYPTYRWHVISGKVSPHDYDLADSIRNILVEIKNSEQQIIVFCPIGIGGHVDHIITRDCCLEIFDKLVLWSDFPYNKQSKLDFSNINDYEKMVFYYGSKQKEDLLKSYNTQYAAMFPGEKIGAAEEIFYFNSKK